MLVYETMKHGMRHGHWHAGTANNFKKSHNSV